MTPKIRNVEVTHVKPATTSLGFSLSKDCMAISNRADAVLLARLRAGHTPLLKACAYLLDLSAGPLCPLCKGSLKGCWRSHGPPSGRPLALKPQQQQQPGRPEAIGYYPVLATGAHYHADVTDFLPWSEIDKGAWCLWNSELYLHKLGSYKLYIYCWTARAYILCRGDCK